MNIKIFNFPGEKNPFTTVLGKQNLKKTISFHILPIKRWLVYAILEQTGCKRPYRKNCLTKRIVQYLPAEKGFSKTLIQGMKSKEKPYYQQTENKKFTGITV